MPTSVFRVPNNGLEYVRSIHERSFELIDHGIWSGIDKTELIKWCNNFTTDEEKYFSACLLDYLIFRSLDQTLSMIKHLFKRTLPDLARHTSSHFLTINTIDLLSNIVRGNRTFPDVRFVVVAESDDAPTKSAYEIARFMKRYLSIDDSMFIHADQVKVALDLNIRNFIFIDDFLGTGHQFKDFLNNEGISALLPDINAVYIPLAAYYKGIDYIKVKFPTISIDAVEILDETHSLFNDKCFCFHDECNTPLIAKDFYFDMLKKKNINLSGSSRKGYGGCELAFGFSHAAPDNSIPLLWWYNTCSFAPLMKR